MIFHELSFNMDFYETSLGKESLASLITGTERVS